MIEKPSTRNAQPTTQFYALRITHHELRFTLHEAIIWASKS